MVFGPPRRLGKHAPLASEGPSTRPGEEGRVGEGGREKSAEGRRSSAGGVPQFWLGCWELASAPLWGWSGSKPLLPILGASLYSQFWGWSGSKLLLPILAGEGGRGSKPLPTWSAKHHCSRWIPQLFPSGKRGFHASAASERRPIQGRSLIFDQ